MTFSILVNDGELLGLAVATKLKKVGSLIPIGSGKGGVVCAQGLLTDDYVYNKAEVLRQLELGDSPEKAINSLLASDLYAPYRQIHAIDKTGRKYAFTGYGTKLVNYHGFLAITPYAGHIQKEIEIKGKRVVISVAGNILVNEMVLTKMMDKFISENKNLRSSSSSYIYDFALMLLEALKAGEDIGGDARPYNQKDGYSVALRVYTIEKKLAELKIDVDNSPTPISDLIFKLKSK